MADIPQYERTTPIKPSQAVQGFAQATSQMGAFASNIGQIASTFAQESANRYARLQGAEAAENDFKTGKMRETLPFTEADKHFTEAYNKNYLADVAQDGQKMLETFYQTAAQTPTGESLADYEQFGKQGIDQIVSRVSREHQAGLKRALEDAYHSGFLKLSSQVSEANNKYLRSQQVTQSAQKLDNITNYALEGSYQSAKDALNDSLEDTLTQEQVYLASGGKLGYNPEQAKTAREIAEDRFRSAVMSHKWEMAHNAGEGEQFIEDLRKNPPENLSPIKRDSMIRGVEQYRQSYLSSLKGQQAINYTNAITAVDSGQMNDVALIQAQRDLSESDFARLQHYIVKKQAKDGLDAAKVAQAMQDISLGRAASVDKKLINQMFLSSRKALEQEQGSPATLGQQFEMVKKLKTNVPKFDQDMAAKLTSMNPAETLEAGRIYSTAALGNQENLIKLSEDKAKTMAQKMNTLLNGVAAPGNEVVDQTIRQVMKQSDADVAERNKAATKIIEKSGPAMFEELFGEKPDPFMDTGAYSVFKDQFLNSFANGANEVEAARITKDAMREWGKSKYFEDGRIGQFAPEKELPLSQDTHNIQNQLIVAVDSIAKANNEGANIKNGKYKMKLLDIEIPEKLSQVDFIYESLYKNQPEMAYAGTGSAPGLEAGPVISAPVSRPIMIEWNGVKTDVVLKSSSNSKASGPNPVYGLFAKDKFGIYQQLPDPRNNDGLAYVVLKDVDQIAPELFENENDDRLRKTLNRARSRQIQETIKQSLKSARQTKPFQPEFEKLNYDEEGALSLDELKDVIKQNK